MRFVGYLICFLGLGLTLWAFYPGLMSPDSIASLGEGRSGIIYDQNSAIMSYLWGFLDEVVAGPGLMLVLQAGVFWAAILCLWEAAYRESLLLGLALVVFPFMPQILSQLPVIWKDVEMATTLLMSAALVLFAKKKKSKIALLLSPVFLFYGFAARLNSLPAVLPLAIWTGFVAASVFELQKSRLAPVMVGASYFVVLLVSVFAFQAMITEGRTSYPFQMVQLYDLAAISIRNGEPRFPEYIVENRNFSMDGVRANYTPTTVGTLVYAGESRDGRLPVLEVVETQAKIGYLRATWQRQVSQNPGAYLTHRLEVFAQLVGLGRSVSLQYWDPTLSRNPPEFATTTNGASRLLTAYFGIFQRPVMQTFFFRAIVWILLCFYLLYRSVRSQLAGDWDFVFVLSVSSLLYIFSYFFIAPAADFRYVYWPAIASAVAVIFGVYLLRKEKAERTVEA